MRGQIESYRSDSRRIFVFEKLTSLRLYFSLEMKWTLQETPLFHLEPARRYRYAFEIQIFEVSVYSTCKFSFYLFRI